MMYVDLKGFTAFCGSVLGNKADQIINTLNCFFSSAVPCVLEYGGTIDKFQGDGFHCIVQRLSRLSRSCHKRRSLRGSLKDERWPEFKEQFYKLMDSTYGRLLDTDAFTLGLKIGIVQPM